jgi:hypothetical protein
MEILKMDRNMGKECFNGSLVMFIMGIGMKVNSVVKES